MRNDWLTCYISRSTQVLYSITCALVIACAFDGAGQYSKYLTAADIEEGTKVSTAQHSRLFKSSHSFHILYIFILISLCLFDCIRVANWLRTDAFLHTLAILHCRVLLRSLHSTHQEQHLRLSRPHRRWTPQILLDALGPGRAAIWRRRHLHCHHWQYLPPGRHPVGRKRGRLQLEAQQCRQLLLFGRFDCYGLDVGHPAGDLDLADSNEATCEDVCGGDIGNGCIVSFVSAQGTTLIQGGGNVSFGFYVLMLISFSQKCELCHHHPSPLSHPLQQPSRVHVQRRPHRPMVHHRRRHRHRSRLPTSATADPYPPDLWRITQRLQRCK